MTVTPDMGKANDGNNYEELETYGPIPDIDDETQQRFSPNLSGINYNADLNSTVYTKKNAPVVSNPNIFGTDGFYWNGPTADPFSHAQTIENQITSYVKNFSDPAKKQLLNNFTDLLDTYGNTNNAGTLWGIAQSGIPYDSDVAQQILQVDAEDHFETYSQSAPNNVNSPSSQIVNGASPNGIPTIPKDERTINEATDAYETFGENFWTPIEFLARNSFAALTMPLEASQGAMRGIGGALTDEDGPNIGEAIAQAASFVLPPLSLLADKIYGDNEFQNPWEQTEFGQTLLAAADGGGFEAFNGLQAGLDFKRAERQIRLDPEYAEILQSNLSNDELNNLVTEYAEEKGYYAEAGWFVDETSFVGQNQIESAFNAWNIPGEDNELIAWTLGRGIASNIVGPDDSAYNVMSGTIDAVAAIIGDPLIIGGKLGLVGKSVRGVSGAVKGPDNAILIGKEAKKQRTALASTNRGLATAVDNVGADPVDVAKMDLKGQAEVVQESIIKNLVDETNAKIDTEIVDQPQIQNIHRSIVNQIDEQSEISRLQLDSKPVVVSSRDADRIEIWEDFLTFHIKGEIDINTYRRFVQGLTDEQRVLWNEMNALQSQESALGFLGTGDVFAQQVKYLDNLKINAGKEPIKPSPVADNVVAQDSARLQFGNQAEDLESYRHFGNSNKHKGATLAAIPTVNGTGVLAAVNQVDAVVYWTGKKEPVLIPAAEIPSDAVVTRIFDYMLDALDTTDDLRRTPFVDDDVKLVADAVEDINPLVTKAENTISNAIDRREAVTNLLTRTDISGNGLASYEDILYFARGIGLENTFFAALRGTKGNKEQVDGLIGTMVSREKPSDPQFLKGRVNGVQMGNNPKLTAYAIDDPAKVKGKALKKANNNDPIILSGKVVESEISKITSSKPPTILNRSARTSEQLAEESMTAQGRIDSNISKLTDVGDTAVASVRMAEGQLLSRTKEVKDTFKNTESGMKSTLNYNAGMINRVTGGINLDGQGVRNFLFGLGVGSQLGNKVLDQIADVVSESDRVKVINGKATNATDEAIKIGKNIEGSALGRLFVLTKGKWDYATIQKVVDNSVNSGGKEGLVAVLAPRLGIDVTKGSVSRTTKTIEKDGKTVFRTGRTVSSGKVARQLGQMPSATKVNLSDPNEVANAIFSYGRYAKLDEDFIARKIGNALRATGTTAANGASRNALKETFTEINKNLLAKLKSKIKDEPKGWVFKNWGSTTKGDEYFKTLERALEESTSLYMGGITKGKTLDDAGEELTTAINDAVGPDLGKLHFDGKTIDFPDIQIDTEIARGFIGLPSVDEWSKYLNRVARALGRFETTESVYKASKMIFDNFYRSSLLALRVAYIARNSAEMQIRMFLNGHQSVMTDPMTMIGMTFGSLADAKMVKKANAKRKTASDEFLAREGKNPTKTELDEIAGPEQTLNGSFSPFKDTVLGTRFETGLDAELAAANYVDDYFQLMRMSHSLTDPRVYNNAVKTSWTQISYNSPKFVEGWANELIMLQKSELVGLVLKGPKDKSFTGTVSNPDDTAYWLVNSTSKEATDLKNTMIGADPKFEEIFTNTDLTKQYLFDNVNSVQNKITQYTNQDPRLVAFLRTGTFSYGNNQFLRLGSIPKPNERVKQFSTQLKKQFYKNDSDSNAMRDHMNNSKVTVPWIENSTKQKGNVLFNKFFEVANKIERIGTVGPEFRLSYWDRIAELAPGLSANEIDRALAAARTTLSPLKRYNKNGKLDNIGSNHPAFAALQKAKKENSDGLLTLDEIHGIANNHAAEAVKGLFYDATRRNNQWNALRLIIPFGQAWGDTIQQWTRLGAKNKIQVYKAQKAFNAFNQDGSSAIYEFTSGDAWYNAFGNYADGAAPWDQDGQGGFFYQDNFGSTNFSYPFLGRAMAQGINARNALFGSGSTGISDMPISSPADSLNLAVGADGIIPGISAMASVIGNEILPDNEIVGSLRRISQPFGSKSLPDGMTPAWFSKIMAGLGIDGLNVIGEKHKNKAVSDAITILASNGEYPNYETDPIMERKLTDDAKSMSKFLLLSTGLLQSVLPSTPYVESTVNMPEEDLTSKSPDGKEDGMVYGLGFLNTLYQQFYVRNAYDSAAAREEWVKTFGSSMLLATTGDWQGFAARPTSNALAWARQNPEVSKANMDSFTLFFPGGDSSDVSSMEYLKKYGSKDRVRKTPEMLGKDLVAMLERVERERVSSAEVAGVISSDDAQIMRDEITERYLDTNNASFTAVNKTRKLEQLNSFVEDTSSISSSSAGKTFQQAWDLRSIALNRVREQTKDPRATLGSKKALPIFQWYLSNIKMLKESNVDFRLLAGYFEREFEK